MSRRENVFGGVYVPVVDSSASAANPFSYSQTRSTFRTAGGNRPAARASLGGVVFADYLKDDTGLMALVFQHRLEHRPARIQRALGHLGFNQLGADHITVKRPRRFGRSSVDVVPDLIDLTRHLTQHFGVLVFEAQLEGFGLTSG